MQHLLHEAINQEHNHCYGLLTGSGNIVKSCLPVTKKLQSANTLIPKNSLGIYLATDNNGIIEPEIMLHIHQVWQQHHKQAPCYYLILYLDHKGRIDARMYSDCTFKTAITLNMQEDNEGVPTR